MASGVEFDEDSLDFGKVQAASRPAPAGSAPTRASYQLGQYPGRGKGMAGWLVSHGWVKSEGAAQGILLGIVIINIIITYFVIRLFL